MTKERREVAPVVTASLAQRFKFETAAVFLSRPMRWVSLAFVGLSVLMPVEGLGVDLCTFHAATGLPCPGCGMTRAMSALSHGQLGAGLTLHPFVVVAWPLAVFLAALAFAPERLVKRLEVRLQPLHLELQWLWWGGLGALLLYGGLRALRVFLGGASWP